MAVLKKYPKIIAAVAAIFLLAAVAVTWFFLRKTEVYLAIPNSAVVVVEVNNWKSFSDKLNTTYTGMAFRKTDAGKRLWSELEGMGTLIETDKSLTQALYAGSTVASLHLTTADDYDYLFTGSFENVNDNTLLNRVQAAAGVQQVKVRIFKNHKLLDVSLRDGRSITFAALKGILVFSYTSFLTETAVSALATGESIGNQKSFNCVHDASSKLTDIRCYVNFSRIGVMLPALVKEEVIPLFSSLEKSGEWGAYAVRFSNDAVQLSGSYKSDSRVASTMALNKLLRFIPANTSVADISTVDSLQWSTGDLATSFFRDWAGDFRAFLTLEPLTENITEQNLCLVGVKDNSKAQSALQNMLATEGSSTLPVDSFMGKEIYALKAGNLVNRVFGNSFSALGQVFFTQNDSLAVFANNKDVMKLALENIRHGNTLAVLQGDSSFQGELSQIWYVNLSRSSNLLHRLLRNSSTAQDFLSQFSAISISTKNGQHEIESTITMTVGKATAKGQSTAWKTNTGSFIGSRPMLVEGEENNQQEIMVQDTSGTIYLIGAAGDIKFKKQIGAPLMSKIYRGDYSHNGSSQYLFNTTKQVFLLDAQGNDAASYPLRLSRTATAGMSLLRTSNTPKARYFIPCENGAIYGYELSGRPLAGWSPNSIAGNVIAPVSAFSNSGKDYVAVNTTAGRLVLCDGKGNKQWAIEQVADSFTDWQLIQLKNDFTFLSIRGKELTTVDKEGKADHLPLLDSATAFAVTALSDSTYNYVYASGGALRSYDHANTFIHAAAVNGASVTRLSFTATPTPPWIVAIDDSTGKIAVFDTGLKLLRHFEIAPSSQAIVTDLFNTGEPAVICLTPAGQVICLR